MENREQLTNDYLESLNTNDAIDFMGLKVRPFGTKKGIKDLMPVRLMLRPESVWQLKRLSFECHASVGELCHAIVMQWLSEHEAETRVEHR